MYSEGISNFLEFLRNCTSQYNIAFQEEIEQEKLTQDLLHKLELENLTYHEQARIAKKLVEVRRDRRKAKDVVMATEPIVEWLGDVENEKYRKSLERLLGEVKKIEKKKVYRAYVPRSKEFMETNELQEVSK